MGNLLSADKDSGRWGVTYDRPPEPNTREAHRRCLDEWKAVGKVSISADKISIGCTGITRQEAEDILAEMRALDPLGPRAEAFQKDPQRNS